MRCNQINDTMLYIKFGRVRTTKIVSYHDIKVPQSKGIERKKVRISVVGQEVAFWDIFVSWRKSSMLSKCHRAKAQWFKSVTNLCLFGYKIFDTINRTLIFNSNHLWTSWEDFGEVKTRQKLILVFLFFYFYYLILEWTKLIL